MEATVHLYMHPRDRLLHKGGSHESVMFLFVYFDSLEEILSRFTRREMTIL
jgi:hypothetical protein